MKILLATVVAGLLAGCGGLSSKSSPTVTYQLRAAPAAAVGDSAPTAAAGALHSLTLQVLQPVAGPGLETDNIMLTRPEHRLDRYAASRWPAPAPRLLASLAVETLRNRALLSAVHDEASPFQSDYILRIAIRRFDADHSDGREAPLATVVLDCAVGTRGERRLLGSFVAQGTAAAADNRMAAVVAAFEQATRAALGSLADQSLAIIAAEAASN